MKCYKCGAILKSGIKFCPQCGSPVRNEVERPSEQLMNHQNYRPGSSADRERFYQNQPPVPPRRDNTVKWIVAGISVLTVLVILATVIFVVVRLNSGMTTKKICKKYIQVIEQQKDSIAQYESQNDANGVAFVDLNHSGVPDVLYITKDESSERPYLHCVTDGKKDVEVDREEALTGELEEEYTMFREYGGDVICIITADSLRRLTVGQDENGKNSIRMEMLAQRVYDDDAGEYRYYVLSDSGEMTEVSEEEYNKTIDSYRGKKVTVILSTLSDKDLDELFPDLIDNISEKQDDALKRLQDYSLTDDQATPDSAASPKEGSTDALTEEKDKNFVKDHYMVEYDGVVYYVDDDGLWKKEAGSDSELLYSCSATNLATDGRVIYYGVFNENVPYSYYSTTIEIHQYDMYRYDLRTGSNEKLTSFIEAGRPICAIGDVVYYTDFRDDFDGNMAGLAQGIRSYNIATGEKKYLCDGAHITQSCDGKIFYRQIMAAGGNMGVHQIYCYDTQTDSSEVISEDNAYSFKVIDGSLYYVILNNFNNGLNTSDIQLCRYDVAASKTEVLLENTDKLHGLMDYDDKYVVGSNESARVFSRTELASGETDEIPLSDFGSQKPNAAFHDTNATYLFTGTNTSKQIYTVSDDGTSVVSNGSLSCQSVVGVRNQTVFYIEPNDKNYYFYHIDYQEIR